MDHAPASARDRASSTIDLNAAFHYPFQQKDWPQSALFAGLWMMVPLLGMVSLFGWQQDVFERARSGGDEAAPAFDFSGHMAKGWRPFAAMMLASLPLMFLFYVPVLVGGAGLYAAFGHDQETFAIAAGVGAVVFFLFFGVFQIVFTLYSPEFYRLCFRGDLFPLGSVWASWRAFWAHSTEYLLALAGIFLASMASCVGLLAAGVGFFITVPLAMVAVAHIIGQLDRVVEAGR